MTPDETEAYMDDVIKCYCGSSWRRAQRREETTRLTSDPIQGLTFCTLCLSFTPTISGVGGLGGFVVFRRRAYGCVVVDAVDPLGILRLLLFNR